MESFYRMVLHVLTGRGELLFRWESFIFKWCVCPMGGHQFWWGVFEKNCRMGGASPSCPHPNMGNPLYEKFYADNEWFQTTIQLVFILTIIIRYPLYLNYDKNLFLFKYFQRLQGIIQNKSASGSQMLPLVIFDKKSASFFPKFCYFKVFLRITSLKVPFLKDSWCCPEILDHKLDLHWHAPQTQINLHDFLPWRFF